MKPIASPASATKLRAAGLMSGTSCDGVDVAVVDVAGRRAELVAFKTYAYPRRLRAAVLELCRGAPASVEDVCHLNFVLGETFADALVRLARRRGIRLSSIDVIGSHGQTICHVPRGRRSGRRTVRSTLQIGEPCVIAERTGITTVADFRPRDIAAGGQGAPLVPYADWLLLRHDRLARAVQNIGGIANVTYLPARCALGRVVAFDTGPGNMFIDRVTHLATGGRLRFDRDGRLARRGRVHPRLLAEWLRHPYFRRRPPKSTGREEFGWAFADERYARAIARRIDPLDVLATATALTAESIARAHRRFLPGRVDEVIVSGGGVRNAALMAMLADRAAPARVVASDELGLDADAKEAVAFAVLAAQTVRGQANNVPAATGAGRSVVLGKIVPAGR